MISNPILHDIIKSELNYKADSVFDICKTIPSVKTSNLFTKHYWEFKESRQEQLNSRYYQADVVWYFDGKKNDNYYIVHEIKTGVYNTEEIYKKYRTGMSGQIWVWGWNNINNETEDNKKIKKLDIEYLIPLVLNDLHKLISGLVE